MVARSAQDVTHPSVADAVGLRVVCQPRRVANSCQVCGGMAPLGAVLIFDRVQPGGTMWEGGGWPGHADRSGSSNGAKASILSSQASAELRARPLSFAGRIHPANTGAAATWTPGVS